MFRRFGVNREQVEMNKTKTFHCGTNYWRPPNPPREQHRRHLEKIKNDLGFDIVNLRVIWNWHHRKAEEDRFTIPEADEMSPSRRGEIARERDEIIQVFQGDELEPVSILDIDYSIISKFAAHSFRTCRLYVVLDDSDQQNQIIIEKLKKKVANWDKPE